MVAARAVVASLCFLLLCESRGEQEKPCLGAVTASDVLADTDLSGKVIIVTGGDSGLGYATAEALARAGASVVIAVHNQTKGEAAATSLEAAALAGGRAGRVSALPLDLASLASVRAFVGQFLAQHGSSLHMLVNNAGTSTPQAALTPDGFEWVFQVDYLGPFLLAELLLPALRQSQPSSVVNVVSGTYHVACEAAGWPKDCYKDLTYVPPPLVEEKMVSFQMPDWDNITLTMRSTTYPHAKFLQNQYTPELARREAANGVSAYAYSPGVIGTDILLNEMSLESPAMQFLCSFQTIPEVSWTHPPNPCPFSPEQSAAGIAATAAGKQIVPSGSIYYRIRGCSERPLNMLGFTEARQAELYERSLQLIEIGPAAPV